MTSMPLGSRRAFVSTFRSYDSTVPGPEREKVAGVVPLDVAPGRPGTGGCTALPPALAGTGLDDAQPVDAHRLRGGLQERLRMREPQSLPALGDNPGDQRVSDGGAHHHRVRPDDGAQRVQAGAARANAPGASVSTASTVCANPVSNTRRASRSMPGRRCLLAGPDRQHPRRQQQDVAAGEPFQARLVQPLGPGEQRVMSEDDRGDLCLGSPAARAGHRDAVADPHARVPGEHQVGQRVDQVVPRVEQPEDRAPCRPRNSPRARPRMSSCARSSGGKVIEVRPQLTAQLLAEPRVAEHGVASPAAGPPRTRGRLAATP